MNWFWRFFFWGRLRRLKRIQAASAYLAQGDLARAEALLAEARPRSWSEDQAVYHLVMGKLRLEQGQLGEAEKHLHAAQCLGLDRPAVRLNLAIVELRRCQLERAVELLDDVETSDDESLLEQARVIREVVDKVRTGQAAADCEAAAARFRKKHLGGQVAAPDLVRPLFAAVLHGKLSGKDREDAGLCLGSLLVSQCDGRWVLGLEAQDHRVLVRGYLHSPHGLLAAHVKGLHATLVLPAPLPPVERPPEDDSPPA
jgi:tetratricopeptide (TPR) repeat protein